MKFTIDNREYKTWELSNKQLRDLLHNEDLTTEERDCLNSVMLERFSRDLCPSAGETMDNVFASYFSNYVNTCPSNYNTAVNAMAQEHRYLQNEMFKVCWAYIKKLAENYTDGRYDARNEYACSVSNAIILALREEGLYF